MLGQVEEGQRLENQLGGSCSKPGWTRCLLGQGGEVGMLRSGRCLIIV